MNIAAHFLEYSTRLDPQVDPTRGRLHDGEASILSHSLFFHWFRDSIGDGQLFN